MFFKGAAMDIVLDLGEMKQDAAITHELTPRSFQEAGEVESVFTLNKLCGEKFSIQNFCVNKWRARSIFSIKEWFNKNHPDIEVIY